MWGVTGTLALFMPGHHGHMKSLSGPASMSTVWLLEIFSLYDVLSLLNWLFDFEIGYIVAQAGFKLTLYLKKTLNF